MSFDGPPPELPTLTEVICRFQCPVCHAMLRSTKTAEIERSVES